MLILKVGEVVSLENVDGETPTDYRNYPRRVSPSPGLHKQTKKKIRRRKLQRTQHCYG